MFFSKYFSCFYRKRQQTIPEIKEIENMNVRVTTDSLYSQTSVNS